MRTENVELTKRKVQKEVKGRMYKKFIRNIFTVLKSLWNQVNISRFLRNIIMKSGILNFGLTRSNSKSKIFNNTPCFKFYNGKTISVIFHFKANNDRNTECFNQEL